jgi:hypothetical protein
MNYTSAKQTQKKLMPYTKTMAVTTRWNKLRSCPSKTHTSDDPGGRHHFLSQIKETDESVVRLRIYDNIN